GVFAFRRGARILQPWKELTWIGRDTFICDEIALQLLLHRFPHRVLPSKYNCSAQYCANERDPRIWHFHGGKHLSRAHASALWLPAYEECMRENVGGIAEWTPAGDKRLRGYLRSAEKAASCG